MKILIINLLLFAAGFNQALARYIPWARIVPHFDDALLDDDYDIFRIPSNPANDDFYNFMINGDSSEESKELTRLADDETDHLSGLFDVVLNTFLEFDDGEAQAKDIHQNISNEKRENTDDDDEGDEDESNTEVNHLLDDITEDYASVEKSNFVGNEKDSSEEIKTSSRSVENSDEAKPNMEVDIFDWSKSSEENHDENAAAEENRNEATETTDISKSFQGQKTDEFDYMANTGFNHLASFLVALDILGDIGIIGHDAETEDEKKEVEILESFASALDKMMEEDALSKETDSDEKLLDEIFETTTIASNESMEDSNEVTTTTTAPTPTNDSNENEADESNEDADNFVYVVFKDFNGEDEQRALNEHKYSVINPQQVLKPTTSAPFMPENDAVLLSTAGPQNQITEYVEIREDLDTQQDSLKMHEMDLDKDFYAIVSNNFDDNTLNKFEKDIYAAKDNLDRIKKNINALQNIQTKLYFHNMIANAMKEVHKQSQN